MNPKISVIVPVFNSSDYLRRCIESIIYQTYENIELILVDDGSTDSSSSICDEYSKIDPRIIVIHKQNQGVSAARNDGIDLAEGAYICFVDSDDYVEKDYLELLFNNKEKYPFCDNVWCGFRTKTKEGDTLKKVIFDESSEVSILGTNVIMTLHNKWLDAGPCCKLYNKRIIVDNGLHFDTELCLGEDLVFNYNYLDCTNKKIVVANTCLYNYVMMNDESLSNKYYPNLYSIYKKINSVMGFYTEKWKCDENEIQLLYNELFYKSERILRNTFCEQNHTSFIRKIRNNNRFLKSEEFIECYSKFNGYLHPLFRMAYRTKNYLWIFLLEKAIKALHF